MKNLKKSKVKTQKLQVDDSFKLGGVMYRIDTVDPRGGYNGDKIHVVACKHGGELPYDRVSMFLAPNLKFVIFNQK